MHARPPRRSSLRRPPVCDRRGCMTHCALQAAVYCSHRATFHARQRGLPGETVRGGGGRDGAGGGETAARKMEGAHAAPLQLVGSITTGVIKKWAPGLVNLVPCSCLPLLPQLAYKILATWGSLFSRKLLHSRDGRGGGT